MSLPQDYFKVSGRHYMRNLPKSDVRVVLVVVLLLVSWFFHTIQQQKHDKAVKFLKFATLNNLTLKNGGTKQTLELFRRASELYDQRIEQSKRGWAQLTLHCGRIILTLCPVLCAWNCRRSAGGRGQERR